MPKSRSYDAVVVGAGAVGSAIALELTRHGLAPIVFERDAISGNASGYAWGGLSAQFGAGVPGPMTDVYRTAICEHVSLYEGLGPEADEDWELQRVFQMALADEETKLDDLRSDVEWMQSEGFDAEIIDASEVYRLESSIRPGMIGAQIVNAGYELDSLTFTSSIASAAQMGGATFEIEAVSAVDAIGGRVTGVTLESASTVQTDVVIAATGPWVSGIKGLPGLPIRPMKGEILRMAHAGNDLQQRIGFNGFNVGRKPDGTVWAGTYEWDRGFDRETTEEGRDHILKGVSQYIPSLASAQVKTQTACLRPVSSDGLPIVGAIGNIEGLYAANGAGKKGILLSPLLAKWIGELVVDGSNPPEFVTTERFELN